MFWKLAAASTPVGKARDHFFDLGCFFLRALCVPITSLLNGHFAIPSSRSWLRRGDSFDFVALDSRFKK
ncbi:hypothetical protein FM038_025225 [Shewanella eurypsychrophilus]|uniref:Secreted protein n=1 Tax=Shewanella eurypsychrophilus TaxID=2593656 RepID=A0ABX6VCA5_9GAMM|nr:MULTISPECIES: hypothetical protein [Shewanella]QFU25099.1 hypothetical protein FS418_26850 [Shewanella sp. YLB-09]QPG60271.1 hypothetical protein FM038_025225 [Shewanella eurypsychrophilus]